MSRKRIQNECVWAEAKKGVGSESRAVLARVALLLVRELSAAIRRRGKE